MREFARQYYAHLPVGNAWHNATVVDYSAGSTDLYDWIVKVTTAPVIGGGLSAGTCGVDCTCYSNADCLSSGSPYTCCTGAGAGSCTTATTCGGICGALYAFPPSIHPYVTQACKIDNVKLTDEVATDCDLMWGIADDYHWRGSAFCGIIGGGGGATSCLTTTLSNYADDQATLVSQLQARSPSAVILLAPPTLQGGLETAADYLRRRGLITGPDWKNGTAASPLQSFPTNPIGPQYNSPELHLSDFEYMQQAVMFLKMGTNANRVQQPWDWTLNSNVRGWWQLEETGLADRVNSGTCGASCNLAADSTFPNSATHLQGSFSNNPSTNALECTEANCGGTSKLDLTTGWTIGCWAQADLNNNLRRLIAKGTDSTGSNTTGFMLGRIGSTTAVSCYGTATASNSGTGTWPSVTTQWVNAVCRQDGTNLRPYINGVAAGSNVAVSSADTAGNFRLFSRVTSTTASQEFSGRVDECYVVAASMSDAQICRVAECGMDGTLCACDNTTHTGYLSCGVDADCREANVPSWQSAIGSATCNLNRAGSSGFCTANGVPLACCTGSNTGTCGTCSGRDYGTCLGGANAGFACNVANQASQCPSSTCTQCTLPSCNDVGP